MDSMSLKYKPGKFRSAFLAGAYWPWSQRHTSLNSKIKRAIPDTKDIANTDVIRSYLGLLSLGKSDYEAVTDMRNDKYFKQSLGIKQVPSAETLRQRFDETAKTFAPIISASYAEFIRHAKGIITPLATGHVAVDMDIFCMDRLRYQKKKAAVSTLNSGKAANIVKTTSSLFCKRLLPGPSH